jgi:hypothetical protein
MLMPKLSFKIWTAYDGYHHHIHFTMVVSDAVPIEEERALRANLTREQSLCLISTLSFRYIYAIGASQYRTGSN